MAKAEKDPVVVLEEIAVQLKRLVSNLREMYEKSDTLHRFLEKEFGADKKVASQLEKGGFDIDGKMVRFDGKAVAKLIDGELTKKGKSITVEALMEKYIP